MSMIKLITPGSQKFNDAVTRLIKLGSRGILIGDDLDSFIKRAGHQFADALRTVEFAPGEVPIHMFAVGATEFYGPNRNGDGFKEATCRKYHPTFVKHARWYRNHANKDTKKSYGIVKFSAYNERMKRIELIVALNGTKEAADRNGGLIADKELQKLASNDDTWGVSMACPRLGTLVKLKRGYRKVEDIRPGDKVLTHRGRYKPVYATIRRTKQQYAKIATKYYGRQVLEFTPEHEFYVARWEDIPSNHQQTAVGRSWLFKKTHRQALAVHARWMPCGDLKPGDFLLMPIYRGSGKSDLLPETARAMGYYTAEGSVTAGGYPCFTCNKEDNAIADLRVWADSIRRTHSEHTHSASDKAVNLTVYSKPYGGLMASEVGCGVRNKVVPQTVYEAPADVKLEYLAGWFNGDGWQDDKGLHWSTCSRSLSLELQMLLASIGVPASVYRIDHTSDLPDRPRSGDGIEYTVNVSNRYSGMFAGRSKAEIRELEKEKTTVFITGDYLAVPVKSVEVVEEEVEVCDLSVEDDESFTAYGLAVHNCRVPFDVCSGCQKQARHRGEYCTADTCKYGGLLHNITKVAADGHVLHADNPDPTFFDISDVYRPADRIAFVLGHAKAASGYVRGGAELAEEAGIGFPFDLLTAGMEPATAGEVKLAYELAALEEQIHKDPASFVSNANRAFDSALQSPVTDVAILVKSAAGRAQVWNALAGQMVMLPVRDFLCLALGEEREKIASLADRVTRHIPGVYGRLIADENLESVLASNPYRTDRGVASSTTRRWAEKCAADHSVSSSHVEKRVMRSALRNLSIPAIRGVEKLAADGQAEGLAHQYALYKLAFLRHWAASVEAPRMSELAIRQNYISG